ncbi:maleylpyruvate isomerase family mycothiol-dependent enzyme [Actinomadura sp. LD22]|uniref:Maleylpyruvate isomerase family mycothiol-dependent enzyme n=1 Tax=Actinomadura physcomitrii TaxID=2650748 RepID=A0A6I4MIT9_9ACTN|nr:maleylpyruvate isomerase family mycothiol-dependent enzyme [Actinomadura physcomitrii]MWA02529.1 maleylpyruvate isomerase family mycothiol-dependent enzyme [Actinomadura physcomitrii]
MSRDADRKHVTDALVGEWAALDRLLTGLTDAEWTRPTCLPGWRVTDVVAHLIGTESMLAGEPVPETGVDVSALPHVRNDIAAVNEQWVTALREQEPAAMLARFRDVTSRRAEMLAGMSDAEFGAPSWTPAGQATYGRFMQIRIYDCYLHEQDVRAAVGRPGNEDGPAADAAVDEAARALGFVVGKRAAAPDGSTVLFDLTGPVRRGLAVKVDGRARLVDGAAGEPTTALRLPSTLFLRLCGGRTTAHDSVEVAGDRELGRRVLDNLAFTI